ncbi:hypothetical protein ABW20_dc0108306 [Dactylellina cionopaga]|nr:hypothetical protein ABW20_dc0108306 [Dactylellina cionopaga]
MAPGLSPKGHENYAVGWICALPKEQTAARALLDEIHPDLPPLAADENTYILGSMSKHNVAITCLPKGKVGTAEAAVAATEMLRTFPSIKIGLMVGIGGGIPPKVKLGDVVVSTPSGAHPGVVQWDFGKEDADRGFVRTGAMNNPPRSLLKTLTKLETIHDSEGNKIREHLERMREKYPRLAAKYTRCDSLTDPEVVQSSPSTNRNDRSWFGWLISVLWAFFSRLLTVQDPTENYKILKPMARKESEEVTVHYGLIASGNKVIKDAEVRDNLNVNLGGNVLCVEMEAAGLVNFPCLVIRGICDYADSRKNDEWQEYAAAVAAAFAKELLEYIKPGEIEGEKPMKHIISQR